MMETVYATAVLGLIVITIMYVHVIVRDMLVSQVRRQEVGQPALSVWLVSYVFCGCMVGTILGHLSLPLICDALVIGSPVFVVFGRHNRLVHRAGNALWRPIEAAILR